ncbi:MAG: SHOCT domain-containing protein [Firmicutes bacterium]|jgi:uncharacterized membrane protein|uniref:SHOCT domain-containing protein n=1 Tax=Sulfobacillus benefaciens TaxID=453960 RepID=A0A2T2X4K3_9FIRM|nr:SHOCT domain-containing protein [Bacillota bacterium]MCL5013709.1 SHOCT domain-containing protein [Bacillota bacterium]PSR29386.1 MAG: hypothetical protein C7B43_08580 [Sulfobacillus benefaciens]HBQ94999.1 hypothetical protein [Sulfobacillus sp.]
MGGMMTMMWISNVLWIGLIIMLGLGIWYWIRSHSDIRRRDNDPLAILKLRLSRGEITLEEYEEIRKRLQS